MSQVSRASRECIFYDHCNSFAGAAKYWNIDADQYAFEYGGKIYACTRTETPEEFKNVTLVMPKSTFALWLQYETLVLGIFNKYEN